jgi:DNA-directed RNA polymerase alpha subunit
MKLDWNDLKIPYGIKNSLVGAYYTVENLLDHSPNEILKLRNIGKIKLSKLVKELKNHKLYLKINKPPKIKYRRMKRIK